MSQKTLAQRFLSSLVDTLHHWSGIMLDKPSEKATVPAASETQVLKPPIESAYLTKQLMVAITVLLEPNLADEVAKLANAMETSEQDVLIRLVKLAKMIHDFGLYGVPTPEGNYLGIHIQKTGEVQRIHLECKAQQKHHPPQSSPPQPPPPKHLN